MITSIPTAEDFRSTGIALINLAWESVITVAQNLAGAPVENWGDENDAETIATWKAALDGYLQSAQQALATAVALAQQGTEFLLKSKIAAVSPFLLISSSPGDWPKGCEKADTPFADFKTIDAQDLPRAHDCVCSPRLSEEFRSKFDQLRRLRNTVMHTVDRRARFTVQDGVLAILEVVEALVAPQGWVAIRRSHLQSTPALSPIVRIRGIACSHGRLPAWSDCFSRPRCVDSSGSTNARGGTGVPAATSGVPIGLPVPIWPYSNRTPLSPPRWSASCGAKPTRSSVERVLEKGAPEMLSRRNGILV